MSIKVTRKELNETFNCIGCGYCEAQYLLNYENPIFYNCGMYGWNFSGYILRHSITGKTLCLTTGYRNIINNDIVKNDYEIISKYNKLAEKRFSTAPYPEREELQQLINDLIDKIYQLQREYYESL